MKKLIVPGLILLTTLFQYCSNSKKAASKKKEPVISYNTNIAPLMMANCTPCHFPPKGQKEPLDNYVSVKNEIDEILYRIQKNKGEKGFMPARHEKLSDSTIQL